MVSMRQTGPMKADTARRIRRTAELVDQHHPETVTGGHLRDAAKMISGGYTDAAKRHLDAAMEVLTPRNLIRHGILDDEGHATAKHHMHEVHRHRLAVQDIEDVRGRNDDLREKARQAAAARQGGPGRGVIDTGTRPGPPQQQPQPVRGFSSWGEVERAIELAFWNREPRTPAGEWTSASGDGASAMHGQVVHGLSGKGEIITGTYDHQKSTVTPRHGGAVGVVRLKPTYGKGLQPSQKPARAYSSLANEVELAFPVMAWKNEARDPHSGKWASGPVSLGQVRRHMATSHSMGLHPEMSAEQLIAQHERLHHSLPGEQNHHHVVTGGGSGSAYGRMRAARDFQAAANSPALPPGGPARNARGKVMGYSSWEEVCSAIELSARTAMLERTPAPRGRPGGPGLYHVSGMGHTPYMQQVVKALIEKRGMEPGKAYAIARAAIRKWSRGGAHAHPEVVAAAGKAEAGEVARQARAHTHANSTEAVNLAYSPDEPRDEHGEWSEIIRKALAGDKEAKRKLRKMAAAKQSARDARPPVTSPMRPGVSKPPPGAHTHTADQARVIELFNPNHAPPGAATGGQFAAGSGSGTKQQQKKKDPNAGKGMAGKTAGSRARLVQRAKLQTKARGIRGQIRALLAQLPQHHKASKAAATKAGKAQTPAQAAAAAKAATAAKSKTSTPRKKSLSPATIHAKINALRAELAGIEAQIRAL